MQTLYSVLRLFLALIVPTFLGYNVIMLIFKNDLRKLKAAEQIFISFGIGISFITFELFIFSFWGVSWSFLNLMLPWAILLFFNIGWVIKNRRNALVNFGKKPELDMMEKFLICGIFLEIIYVFFKTFALPLEAPDAIAIYGIKAKAFFLKGSIYTEIFKDKIFSEAHPDYPLLLPLAEMWIYKVLGELNDFLVKILFPIYFLGTISVFYSIMRNFIKKRGALLFTFFLASVPQVGNFGTNGYADILMAFYYTAAFLYLFLWMKEKKLPYLLLSALLSFSFIWTKNDGFMLFLVNIIILLIFLITDGKFGLRKKVFSFLIYFFTIIFLIAPWAAFKNSLSLENDVVNKDTLSLPRILGNIGRVGPILYEYQKHIFGPKRWNIAWLLIISIFVLKFKYIFKKDLKYFTYAIILCIAGYSVVYIITPQNLGWHLSSSASRVMLHFLPVGLFWVALSTEEELNDF